tara:strand:+ start:2980 stop:3702 length:723 start_codon:yes stop_codon:yes gene_type:complete
MSNGDNNFFGKAMNFGKNLLKYKDTAKKAMEFYSDRDKVSRTIAGLRDLKDVTESEREYEKRRRDIIKYGDPMLKKAGESAIQRTRQEAQGVRQRALGNIINQGLENSIVAQELRRKVDKDVLKSIAQQARDIALANAQAKKLAQAELEDFKLKQDDRSRQIKSQISQLDDPNSFGYFASRLGDIALTGMEESQGQVPLSEKEKFEKDWIKIGTSFYNPSTDKWIHKPKDEEKEEIIESV